MKRQAKIAALCAMAATVPFALQAKAVDYKSIDAVPAYAPASVGPSYFDGFYLGVGVEHENLDHKFDIRDASEHGVMRGGGSNVGASLLLGYGQPVGDQSYLGLEAFGRFSAGELATVEASGLKHDKLDGQWSFGADVQAGYLVTPRVMPYILAGVDVGHFKDGKLTNSSGTTYTDLSKTVVGFMPGVGMRVALSDSAELYTQYTYTWYAGFHKDFSANDKLDVKPRRSIFTVGLAYRFDLD